MLSRPRRRGTNRAADILGLGRPSAPRPVLSPGGGGKIWVPSRADSGSWLAGATAWAGSDVFTNWDLKQYDNDKFQLDGRKVDLDQSSGHPFGEWGVSAHAIQNDYFGITRGNLPLDQASALANSINAGTQTETQYIDQLLAQVADTSIPAVSVEASMYGAVGTSAEINLLVTQFLPGQVANAIAHGLNPQVYASEALGLAFAFGNETGSTKFANDFGPSNPTMPNSTAGDATFASAASAAIFGPASTSNLINVLDGFVANWKAFYSNHGVPGLSNASPLQIDLAARAAAWGDGVGIALANNIGPLNGQAINFLEDAAHGTAVYSAALTSQPDHAVFQGAPAVDLVGIGIHPDSSL